jgi:hypothetical protein
MEGHHHFQAARLNPKEVELLNSCANGSGTDLFDDPDPVVRVDDLVADTE